MKNIKKYPISKLSFIILTDNYTQEEKQQAKQEIQRRFSTNGGMLDYYDLTTARGKRNKKKSNKNQEERTQKIFK